MDAQRSEDTKVKTFLNGISKEERIEDQKTFMSPRKQQLSSSEFHENCGTREMHALLKEYAEVEEVLIPSKRDKIGKRCGFFRFKNILD